MGKVGDEVGPSLLCQFWVNHIPILGFQPQRLSNYQSDFQFGNNFTQVGHYPMIKYQLQYRIPQLIHDSSIEQCNSRWNMYYEKKMVKIWYEQDFLMNFEIA